MHIIIDCTTTQDQFAYSGIGQYTKNITLSLAKLNKDTKYSILLFEGKESTLDKEIKKYKNIKVTRVGKYKLNDYKNDITYKFQILPAVKRIRRKDSIYFCPYFWRNYPSDKMPTVLFIHDMNLPIFNMYSQQSELKNWIRKMQYWSTLDKSLKCTNIICNSETTRNDYLKYYPEYIPDNVSVSYLGVDIEEKEVSLSKILPDDYREKGYLIYLGGGINRTKNSLGVVKGYKRFVDILKQRNIKNIPYLVIAGGKFQDTKQWEVWELYELIKKYGLLDNVVFTGFYPDEAKYSLLKNAFAFIHLSIYEGFGISVVEALRSKVPTILDKNPTYIELFDGVSIIVDGTKPKQVGQKIYDIYTKREKYQPMVKRGYEYSLEFNWENTAKKTYKIFDNLHQEMVIDNIKSRGK